MPGEATARALLAALLGVALATGCTARDGPGRDGPELPTAPATPTFTWEPAKPGQPAPAPQFARSVPCSLG